MFPTMRSAAKIPKVKVCRMNDKTLDLFNGELRCRLNPGLSHLPEDNVNEQGYYSLKCDLHQWHQRDKQYKKNFMVCSVCRVTLCKSYYKKFHQIHQVDDLKAHMVKICAKTHK